ncbi:metal-dependent hydrolase [Paenibacillus sp. 481]|uniref:metal-dependent hydrolase n=1 Tax=Paenibacillus sp. 481 TaxID=2835869 RepID=UPI001E63AF36|nr:metal-dependent hydrolase [Paenibacillus sp. 481]UHA74642.1 metal-dependent hydrolase [Paenibacillus sp. 481]
MDTGTHFVVGLGLAGLSQIDPVVATHSATAGAVFLGVILGSQAPDFDTALRLKSNTLYVRHHRGFSHSIPMLFVWTLLIAGVLTWAFAGSSFLHVAGWTGLAVCLHVFMDMFNTYGTQAARPFSERWISWNIISIFDPFIFVTHVTAVALWVFGLAAPRIIFPTLYLLLAVYYVWRTLAHRHLLRKLPTLDAEFRAGETYTLIPTVSMTNWNIVKHCHNGAFRIGNLKQRNLQWFETAKCDQHPAVEASKQHSCVQALLYFTRYACATVQETDYGYAVRWVDVRYRHRKQYPFVAVVLMNKRYDTLDYYIGWISNEKMQQRYGLEMK